MRSPSGHAGVIVQTDDGGKKWIQRQTEAKDHLYSVTFTGENFENGWTVGTYGTNFKDGKRRLNVGNARFGHDGTSRKSLVF